MQLKTCTHLSSGLTASFLKRPEDELIDLRDKVKPTEMWGRKAAGF